METIKNDTLVLGGKEFRSRFILGSGKFSLQLIHDVMEYGGSEIATIALRRANADSPENILDFLPEKSRFPLCNLKFYIFATSRKQTDSHAFGISPGKKSTTGKPKRCARSRQV